jgi:hypothetical protein
MPPLHRDFGNETKNFEVCSNYVPYEVSGWSLDMKAASCLPMNIKTGYRNGWQQWSCETVVKFYNYCTKKGNVYVLQFVVQTVFKCFRFDFTYLSDLDFNSLLIQTMYRSSK